MRSSSPPMPSGRLASATRISLCRGLRRSARLYHGQQRLAPAERAEPYGAGGRGRCEQGQLGFCGAGDRLHERQAVRMRETVPAGDVDRAQDPSGVRVVQWRGRARPLLHRTQEVLGREHLDRAVHGDGRPRRVSAGDGLRPAGALHEVHPTGPPSGHRVTLDPQQPAVRVAHRQQVLPVRRVGAHQLPDHRHGTGERMGLPVRADVVGVQIDQRGAVRADAGPRRAAPGFAHHRADRSLQAAGRGEHLVRVAQFAEPFTGVRVGCQGQPGVRQLTLPSRGALHLPSSSQRTPATTVVRRAFGQGLTRDRSAVGQPVPRRLTRRMYRTQSQFGPGSVWSVPGTCTWPRMCARSLGMP